MAWVKVAVVETGSGQIQDFGEDAGEGSRLGVNGNEE